MGVNAEERPLVGRRIVVTRAKSQRDEFVERLERLGAHPIHIPVIATKPLEHPHSLENALESLDDFDWIVFASLSGVRSVFSRRADLGSVRVAAVGPTTARELEKRGARVSLIAPYHNAQSLVAALCRSGVRGRRILIPQAVGGLPTLQEGLSACGAHVTRVDAYETRLVPVDPHVARDTFARPVDALTFTSPSTVRGFLMGMKQLGYDGFWGIPVFCIGTTTAAAAEEAGFTLGGAAHPAGLDGLIDVLETHFRQADV